MVSMKEIQEQHSPSPTYKKLIKNPYSQPTKQSVNEKLTSLLR